MKVNKVILIIEIGFKVLKELALENIERKLVCLISSLHPAYY